MFWKRRDYEKERIRAAENAIRSVSASMAVTPNPIAEAVYALRSGPLKEINRRTVEETISMFSGAPLAHALATINYICAEYDVLYRSRIFSSYEECFEHMLGAFEYRYFDPWCVHR